MRIAVLGWGSLVWDQGTLITKTSFVAGGPRLPIEFSRISKDGRLTLVIDERDGIPCSSRYAESAETTLEFAIKNLRIREGTNEAGVGHAIASDKHISVSAMERHPTAATAILEWVLDTDFDAVVWTALDSNFSQRTGMSSGFSIEAADKYIRSLKSAQFDNASNYIRKAPTEIQTPLRSHFDTNWPQRLKAERIKQ